MGDDSLAKLTTPRIFVTLAGSSLAALEAQGGRLSTAAAGLELRLDYLPDFTQLEASLHQMLVRLHMPQVIATCRRQEAGGAYKGSVAQQAAVLAAAVRAGSSGWTSSSSRSRKRVRSSWGNFIRPR